MNVIESKVVTDEREVGGIEARELLPCPFCGGEALFEGLVARKGFEASVVCSGCLAYMPTITYDTEQEAEDAAIKAWNRRV